MKTLFLGFYVVSNQVTFGHVLTSSQFQCEMILQDLDDGKIVHLTSEDGDESPPVLFGICVDPDRAVPMGAFE